jgi:hypothetical protein
MADSKISALPASTTPLSGTEVLPIVQSGATTQVSVANLTAGRAISATAVTASTGNFVVGTSGQGVDFSATPGTGTSELFADYEEGTWTPVDVSGAGLTFGTGTSYYTKVGRLVTASFVVIYPATVNGATANISLPVAGVSGTGGTFFTYQTNGVTYLAYVTGTSIQFVSTSGVSVPNSSMSTFRFDGVITYIAA